MSAIVSAMSTAPVEDGRAELARRAARLGLVRASELGSRRTGATPGPVAEPVTEPVPEPVVPVEHVPDPESSGPLPVAAPLAGLLPGGGLRRGSTVAVSGSSALVLAVLAEASRAGSWCALVGLPGIGIQAAAEAGLDLARTALVPRPGPRPATVVAALVDGVDVVVLGGTAQWRAGDRQRLAARVRQRGAVLVPVIAAAGAWPGAEVELHASGGTWAGLAGDGAGRLRSRRVHLRCAARGRARDHRADALLPGPAGACAPVDGSAVAGDRGESAAGVRAG